MQFLNILFLLEETWRHQQQINFAIPKYFVLVWRNLKTPAAATNYIRTTDGLCTVRWSRPPVSQHSTLSHYQSETEILNICTFCKKIVYQQKYLTSVLFVDRHNWSLSCSMINATCLDAATKHSKLQKKCIHDMLMLLTHV